MYSSGTISPPGGRTLQNLKEELKTEKKKTHGTQKSYKRKFLPFAQFTTNNLLS
jgi:hypothetical protein